MINTASWLLSSRSATRAVTCSPSNSVGKRLGSVAVSSNSLAPSPNNCEELICCAGKTGID
ncbi:hypothetical protein JOS77_06055 [Chromobacterium haemolyticum]|nr:hypothetical protein JOS77_06055 [Chromobacterium haemolyticum]